MRLFFYLFVILMGCTNNKSTTSNEQRDSIPDNMSSELSSIKCYKVLDSLNLGEISFLEACYIRYSEIKSKETAKLYANGGLPKEFNFDIGKEDLNYTKIGDTLFVQILFMHNYKDFKVEPISAINTNNVIALGVKGNMITDSSHNFSSQFEFSEMQYKFFKPSNYKSELVFVVADGRGKW